MCIVNYNAGWYMFDYHLFFTKSWEKRGLFLITVPN